MIWSGRSPLLSWSQPRAWPLGIQAFALLHCIVLLLVFFSHEVALLHEASCRLGGPVGSLVCTHN
jgi:hypothetical protein